MKISKSEELYRIRLTKKGVKIPGSVHPASPEGVDIRDAELGFLKSCIDQSANDAPKISEVAQRMTMIDDIDGLTDTDNYLDFSKSDIDLIVASFEKLAGRRSGAWLRCKELLQQLVNPEKLVTKK